MKIISHIPGRIRFKCDKIYKKPIYAEMIDIYFLKLQFVKKVRVNAVNGTILLKYNFKQIDKKQLIININKIISGKNYSIITDKYENYLKLKKKFKSTKNKLLFFGGSCVILKIKNFLLGKFYLSQNLPVLTIAAGITIINDYPMIKKYLKKINDYFFLKNNMLILLIIFLAFVREGFYSLLLLLLKSVNDYLHLQSKLFIEKQRINNISTAHVKKDNNSVPVESLKPGDEIVINDKKSIPVDGVITEGKGLINNIYSTGRAIIKPVKQDMNIKAGMFLVSGKIKLKITEIPKTQYPDNFDSKKIKLHNKLQTKIHNQTRWALAFSIISLLITGSIINSMAVLLVMNPAAINLTLETGLSNYLKLLAKNNIYLKNANFIEKINNTDMVVFDKTGTLTKENYEIKDIITFEGYSRKEILNICAKCEANIYHPVASTLNSKVNNSNITITTEYIPSRGVKAKYKGQKVLIGNKKLLKTENINIKKIYEKDLQKGYDLQKKSTLPIYIVINENISAIILLQQKIEKEAKLTIQKLKENNIDNIWILSGDREQNVKPVAEKLNISNLKSNLTPKQKKHFINQKNKNIMMIGDGLNDIEAMKAADISLTFNNQPSLAKPWLQSDCVIEGKQLRLIPQLFNFSNYVEQTIYENSFTLKKYNYFFGMMSIFEFMNPFQAKTINTIHSIMAIVFNWKILY